MRQPEESPSSAEDEYETEEQAAARRAWIQVENLGPVMLADDHETITEYGAFNQAEFFDPLFVSGSIHESLRETLLVNPLHVSNSLRSAARFADMRNQERAVTDKMGEYGPVVVRTRTIVRSPWMEVSYEELDRVRGR